MARTHVDARHFDDSVVTFFEPGSEVALAEAILSNYEGGPERIARAERALAFVGDLDWSVKLPLYLRIVQGSALVGETWSGN
jgi:hypothetical protein